jgi:peptidyl-prolyl cis-trans isomerase C
MRQLQALRLAGCLAAAVFLASGEARPQTIRDAAAAGPEVGRDVWRDVVVASIGTPPALRTITAGALADRLAALPPFQRATFGSTPEAARRAFLEQVLVPEALFAVAAEARKVAQEPRTSSEVDRVLSRATIRALRDRIGPAAAIPMEDVQKYYDENRARYDTPERYQLWRILCKTRDDAALVLEQAKKDPTPKAFGELAREHSLDKATNLRDGNLGFLTADGSSNEPGLRVDPAIVRAAQGVRDGELVPAPVPEGDGYSVVWRRGTIAANRRSVDDVAAQIRDALWHARVKQETDRLLDALRAAHLRDYDPALVDTIDIPVDAGATALHKRPAAPPK